MTAGSYDPLELHQRSRREGRAVVSVLVGEPGTRAAEAWAAMGDRALVRVDAIGVRDFAMALLVENVRVGRDLLGAALARESIAAGADDDGSRFRRLRPPETGPERDALVSRAVAAFAGEVRDPALRALLSSKDPRAAVERAVEDSPVVWTDVVAGIASLVPERELPAVLIETAPLGVRELASLATLAEEAPILPLLLAVASEAQAEETLAVLGASRAGAILREGFDAPPDSAATSPTSHARSVGAEPSSLRVGADPVDDRSEPRARVEASCAYLEREAGTARLTPSLHAAAAELVESAPGDVPEDPEGAERARSHAEALLYEVLEALPDTRGLFELNADPGFDFGPRRAEVDLLARRPRIALEVDGWHHFREPDRYRRDRRKDLLLQERGWLVVRVLARDVVLDLELVITMVRQALRAAGKGAAP